MYTSKNLTADQAAIASKPAPTGERVNFESQVGCQAVSLWLLICF